MKDVVVQHGVSVQCALFFFLMKAKALAEKQSMRKSMSQCFAVIFKFKEKKNIADLLIKSQNPVVTAEI